MRRPQAVLAVALGLLLAAPMPGSVEATLQDYLSFPVLTWLTASVDGTDLAWVQTQDGVANVWLATSLDGLASRSDLGAAARLTQYATDDGHALADLAFASVAARNAGAAAHRFLLFSRYPVDGANPLHLIVPPGPQLVAVQLDGASHTPTVVVEGVRLAAVAFGAGLFAYVRDGSSLSVQALSPGSEPDAPPLVATVSHGAIAQVTFGPHGKTLAFVNVRGDHSHIGIWTLGSPSLEYVPSFDNNLFPTWSADGLRLAFLTAYQNITASGQQLNVPFSVQVYTLEQQTTVELFRDQTVGYPFDNGFGMRKLAWLDDQTLVFPFEGAGWLHVHGAGEGGPRDLTPGACEVQDFLPSGGDAVLVADNCDTLDARSVAVVNAKTGQRTRLAGGDVHHVAGLAADGGYGLAALAGARAAYVQQSVNCSGEVFVVSAAGGPATRLSSNCVPAPRSSGGPGAARSKAFITPKPITFASAPFTIHGQLFQPATSSRSGAVPGTKALIFTHGGPRRQMFNAFHYCADYAAYYAMNQYFASLGYTVLSVNYRLGIGYGRAFRKIPDGEDAGAAEYQDVLNARLWLGSALGMTEVGIYGLSYGGLNTLQALARNSDLFKVGVANAPVFNWVSQNRFDDVEGFVYMPSTDWSLPIGPESNLAAPDWPQLVDQNIKLAWASSPAGHVDNLTSPLLLIHGDGDHNVDVQESIGLIHALRARGRNVTALMFPDENHGLILHAHQLIAAQATVAFIGEHLPLTPPTNS